MNEKNLTQFHYAICIDNSEYPVALEAHKIYRIIPDEEAESEGDLRVIDESGEDYLYPADYFLLLHLPYETVVTLERSFLPLAG
jgi:hypothetical protein